ncbi:MAG: Nif3-like dinuclear metal center hexameric protein [Candidatus Methylacidiphilales bacterium]|nr:Nif3-like dinuclear metal center hexameric protein [Candidatus Methylacidiphilales bacterium]
MNSQHPNAEAITPESQPEASSPNITQSQLMTLPEPQPLSLATISDYLTHLLRHKEIGDYSGAHNGLQIENRTGTVTRIAAAVDAHEGVLNHAAEAGADLLLVHHGMLWSGPAAFTGASFRKLRTCMESNLAVFSSHLPLDAHEELGNNALLAHAIGLPSPLPFFVEKGTAIGRRAEVDWTLEELIVRLTQALDGHTPHIVHAGAGRVRRIGIITGGAGNCLREVAAEGIDTFITGEGRHDTFGTAVELGINLIYGGHYLTETFGVKALAQHVSERFAVPWDFIDVPSGL